MNKSVLIASPHTSSFLSSRKSRILVISVFCILSLFIHLWQIDVFRVTIMSTDETGYWGIAAYWAGLDWSGIMQYNLYYSYGYSFLLTPLFWIFNDPTAMYQAALVINCILIVSIIPVAYKCGLRFFPHCNRWLLILTSFAVSIYSGYIVNTHIARNECLLFFLFWVLLLLFSALNTEAPLWKFILFSFLLGYTYMVHQRTIGILIAAFIVLILMCCRRCILVKQLIVSVIVLFTLLFLHTIIKNDLQTNVWLSSSSFQTNDASSVSSRAQMILSPSGIKQFFKVLSGQLFYIGASTFLLAFSGIVELASILYGWAKNSISAKKAPASAAVPDQSAQNRWCFLFLILAAGFTICISVVFFLSPSRFDHAVYGRYNEVILMPLAFIGIIALITRSSISITIKRFFLPVVGFIILGIITYFATRTLLNEGSFIAENCIPGIGWAREFFLQQWHLIVLIPCILFILFFFLTKIKKRSLFFKSIFLSALSGLFLFAGYNSLSNNILPIQTGIYTSISQSVDQLNTCYAKKIYYFVPNPKAIMPDLEHIYISHLQFMLPDTPIEYVDAQGLQSLADGQIVLALIPDVFCEGFLDSVLLQSLHSKFAIGIVNHTNANRDLVIPIPQFSTQNGIVSQGSSIVTSSGQPGFLLYGPYLPFPAGRYEVRFSLKALEYNHNESSGYIDVTANNETIAFYELQASDIKAAKIIFTVDLPFELLSDINNLEFRLYTNKDVILQVSQVRLIKDS